MPDSLPTSAREDKSGAGFEGTPASDGLPGKGWTAFPGLPGTPGITGKFLLLTASMARRCCARRAANDNDGSEMLYPQQRRANDAVPPGPANDNNGPAMLLPARTYGSPQPKCGPGTTLGQQADG
jgi:hypothetical protein